MENYESLRKEYVKKAKRADQQLIRLEALSHEQGYRDVLQWAYRKATYNIEAWEGKKTAPAERPRFNRNVPDNMKELKQRLADVDEFLNSPTSTKRKITKIYKKRVDTINKKMDTNLTWQEFADLTESGIFDEMKDDYGSDTTFDVIAEMQRNKNKFKDIIQKSRNKNIKLPEGSDYNIVMQEVIQKELDKHGLTLLNMI